MASIFLSYISEDNGSVQDGKSKGWVDYFDECLGLELAKLDEHTNVWRDIRDMNHPGSITDTLKQEVIAAAALLVVLSPRYRTSEYARFELSEFLQSRTPGERPTSSILPLLTQQLAPEHFPPPLRGLKYISFFDINPVTKAAKPFYDGYGRDISNKYFDAVRQVADFIMTRLGAARPEKRTRVYLAEPGPDQVNNHWKIHSELDSQKCEIAPIEPWPAERDEAADHLGKGLKSSKFSIHLLGALPGIARREDMDEFAAKQLDWAATRQQQDPAFRRLIWIPPDLVDPRPEQKALIRRLENGTLLTSRDELVRDGLEAFKEVIREELVRLDASRAGPH